MLSFDVEEFDIPIEYGQSIDEAEQISVSASGTQKILQLLKSHQIKSTCFTTANFAIHQKSLVKTMSKDCEIASHGYWHSRFEIDDLKRSKDVLEEISGQQVYGFRRARFAYTPQNMIFEAGYRYNSSENPIWMPGRYNNFFGNRTAYIEQDLLNIPISATPTLRIPLFWLAIKNFPLWLIHYASRQVLKSDGYLNIFFHPWEFEDIEKYHLPKYVTSRCGEMMLDRLDWYIRLLKQHGEFIYMKDYEI
ncbi:Polysaccharide deacetylase [Poriferisphaera corsica]|uniref:Polysaccharide deacetylase n=2 Tax=Poriferisphaera corsica TaxID=2528020 RepID=A0A517YVB8_9BACT|nr:Polysaccharide deacetylase [Poriferisphaera corsica]